MRDFQNKGFSGACAQALHGLAYHPMVSEKQYATAYVAGQEKLPPAPA
jgi:hypothetical protein